MNNTDDKSFDAISETLRQTASHAYDILMSKCKQQGDFGATFDKDAPAYTAYMEIQYMLEKVKRTLAGFDPYAKAEMAYQPQKYVSTGLFPEGMTPNLGLSDNSNTLATMMFDRLGCRYPEDMEAHSKSYPEYQKNLEVLEKEMYENLPKTLATAAITDYYQGRHCT